MIEKYKDALNIKDFSLNFFLGKTNKEMETYDDICCEHDLQQISFFIGSLYKDELNVKVQDKKIAVHFDHIGKVIKKTGNYYEAKMLSYIKSLNLKGNYIDVGANIGNHSLFFSKIADKVFSFEPNRLNYEKLLQNVQQNELKNVFIHDIAIGEKKGMLKMIDVPNNMGMSYFEDVAGQTLVGRGDDFEFQKVCVLKIDCENMSFSVLKSFEQTILKNKPHIFIEADNEILYYIKSKGWKVVNQFNHTPTYHVKTN